MSLLVTYEIFNRRFEVKTSEEEHFKLQNDDNYSRNYFEKILANTEPEVSQVDTVVQGTFNWSRNVILLLVDQYKKNIDKFRDPKIKKKSIWSTIVRAFHAHNYKVTEDILDRKWRNMKKTYVNIKDSIKSTGNDHTSTEPLQTAPKERINVLKRKRVAMKGITLWRSNILSVEKEKVYELRKLREAVERNNDLADKKLKLQEERNNLLRQYLQMKTSL
ncbi:hypothetical protein FQR65_LT17457 [Abscondita terminalis]|nr:hypothetical protein FQR65_LT17457 [Abscondita terminalis]